MEIADAKPPCAVDTVLPPYMRKLIPFDHFTRMQSEALSTWHTDKNLLVSAPTGAGKTVCFELAIFRLIHSELKEATNKQLSSNGLHGKIVYISPTKSLCSERFEDWKAKFAPLLLRVELVTGDSRIFAGDARLADADIILTTTEKWDSITRNVDTNNPSNILSKVSLLLLDEVHQLGDSRGAAFETVVTRMLLSCDDFSFQASSGGHTQPVAFLRIIAASATIQNLRDVADWLRVPDDGLLVFDESYRPVPLDYIVKGYYATNPWQYGKVYDKNVLNVLLKYGEGKPAIVFCTSRRQTSVSAQALLERLNLESSEALSTENSLTRFLTEEQRRQLLENGQKCGDVMLRSLLPAGIAIHNADMSAKSRLLVETLFKKRVIPCLFSTSTLAQGVNLPARLVVICGTNVYHDGSLREYDRNLFLQMCGRAGRPGLDQKGVVVIMTMNSTKAVYENARSSCKVVESQLTNQVERYMNVEIARQGIRDISTAAMFLTNSFYWVRLQKMRLSQGINDAKDLQPTVMDLAVNAINELVRVKLVTFDDDVFGVSCTKLGICMAKYCLCYETVRMFVQGIPEVCSPSQVMNIIAKTGELTDGVFVRRLEKKRLNELNSYIRLPVKGRVKEVHDKVSVLIQTAISGNDMLRGKDYSLSSEADRLMETASRICHAILEMTLDQVINVSFEGVRAVLQVCRGVINKCLWNGASVMREVCGLSDTNVRDLLRGGVTSVAHVCDMDGRAIANIMRSTLSTGQSVLKRVKTFPRLTVHTNVLREHGTNGRISSMEIQVHVFMARRMEGGRRRLMGHGFVIVGSPLRGLFSVSRFKLDDGGCTVFCSVVSSNGGKQDRWIDVAVGCDDLVGLDVCERYEDGVAEIAGSIVKRNGTIGMGAAGKDELFKNGVRDDVRLSVSRGKITKKHVNWGSNVKKVNVKKDVVVVKKQCAKMNRDVDLQRNCDTHVTDVSDGSSDLNDIQDRGSEDEQKDRAVNGLAKGNNNVVAPASASDIASASQMSSKRIYDDVFRHLF